MIKILLPYAEYMRSQIEAAVIDGALPWEALVEMFEGVRDLFKKTI